MGEQKKKKSYKEVKAEFDQLEAEKRKQDAALTIDQCEYIIDGKKYIQSYLTINEMIRLTRIIENVNYKNVNSPIQFLQQLEAANGIDEFFKLVLSGEYELQIEKIKPKQAIKIITDFFYLNEISEIIGIVISNVPKLTQQLTQQTIGMK